MRIIGKQHDYYDSALAHGHDDRVVFVRKREELPGGSNKPKFITGLNMRLSKNQKVNKEASFNSFTIGFCGKLYPGVMVRISSAAGLARTITEQYVYTKDDLIALLASHELERGKVQDDWFAEDKGEAAVDAYFARMGSAAPMDFMIEHKAAILTYDFRPVFGTPNGEPPVVINGTLKEFEFYRVMNAYQAFQELDMFVSGVLTQNENMTVEIADKDRIPQHGFDKYSFRKPPQK